MTRDHASSLSALRSSLFACESFTSSEPSIPWFIQPTCGNPSHQPRFFSGEWSETDRPADRAPGIGRPQPPGLPGAVKPSGRVLAGALADRSTPGRSPYHGPRRSDILGQVCSRTGCADVSHWLRGRRSPDRGRTTPLARSRAACLEPTLNRPGDHPGRLPQGKSTTTTRRPILRRPARNGANQTGPDRTGPDQPGQGGIVVEIEIELEIVAEPMGAVHVGGVRGRQRWGGFSAPG